MKFSMIPVLLSQMFKKPFTNKFPAKYVPPSTTKFLEKVKKGRASIIPPIETPPGFRGKIRYDNEKCTGCKLCIKVCPSGAIEFREKEKKVRFYLSRCTFCSQCNDVCPLRCISMSEEFLLADTDKYSKDLIIE
jgi:formate hydrogenlyase subunit 6/NADH:ubiquinone oxidoreductase subunit I